MVGRTPTPSTSHNETLSQSDTLCKYLILHGQQDVVAEYQYCNTYRLFSLGLEGCSEIFFVCLWGTA